MDVFVLAERYTGAFWACSLADCILHPDEDYLERRPRLTVYDRLHPEHTGPLARPMGGILHVRPAGSSSWSPFEAQPGKHRVLLCDNSLPLLHSLPAGAPVVAFMRDPLESMALQLYFNYSGAVCKLTGRLKIHAGEMSHLRLQGRLLLSEWMDHLYALQFVALRHPVHVVHYERLVRDLPGEIGRLAAFLGRDLSFTERSSLTRQFSIEVLRQRFPAYFRPAAKLAQAFFDQTLRDDLDKEAKDSLRVLGYPSCQVPRLGSYPEDIWPCDYDPSIPRYGDPRFAALLDELFCCQAGQGLTVAHIPARAGSSRLGDKNIQPLGGVPLLGRAVAMAKGMPGVDRVYVNTDSEDYVTLAHQYGGESLGLRPSALAGTTASLGAATEFMLTRLFAAGVPVGKFITILPTSPFLSRQSSMDMIARLQTEAVVVSAYAAALNPAEVLFQGGEGYRSAFNGWCLRPDTTLVKTTGHFCGRNYAFRTRRRDTVYCLLRDPLELIDIDTYDDLALAREVAEAYAC